MTDRITLTYTNAPADTVSAMITGGAAAGRRHRDWPYFILSLVLVVLIAGGGAFVALAMWVWVFDRDSSLVWLLPTGILLAMLIGQLTFRRMINAQAKMTVQSRFGRLPQTLICDAKGITQKNEVAEWHTTWQGVEHVHSTRHGISITVSGIVMPVPDAAFANGPDKPTVIAQLTQWHDAAI